MDKLINLQKQIVAFVKDKYLFIIAFVIFLSFIIIIIIFNVSSQKNNSNTQTIPTKSPNQADIEQQIDERRPILGGDTFDEQTAKDSGIVMTFDENSEFLSHAKKEALSDGTLRYTFTSENPNRSDIFIIIDANIILARHAVVGKASDNYRKLLAQPHDTIAEPTFYGQDTVTYLYAEGGTALIVNPKTNVVYEEFTFQPAVSLEEFNTKYKFYTK